MVSILQEIVIKDGKLLLYLIYKLFIIFYIVRGNGTGRKIIESKMLPIFSNFFY